MLDLILSNQVQVPVQLEKKDLPNQDTTKANTHSKEPHVILSSLPLPKQNDTVPLQEEPKEIKISIKKLVMNNPDQRIVISKDLLDSLPKYKYRPANYLDTLTLTYVTPVPDKDDSDAMIVYSSSNETVPYWPLDDNQQINILPDTVPAPIKPTTSTHKPKASPKRQDIPTTASGTVHKFNNNVVGIKKH